MQAASVRSVRFLMGWPEIEPRRGSFDWKGTDRLVGQLASHAIQPVPFVFASPWVSSEVTQPPIDSAPDRAAWTAFLKALVERYGPDGSYWTANTPAVRPAPSRFRSPPGRSGTSPTCPITLLPNPRAGKYAHLLRLPMSDHPGGPNAEIVLAGCPDTASPTPPGTFSGSCIANQGSRTASMPLRPHPYARTVDQLKIEI